MVRFNDKGPIWALGGSYAPSKPGSSGLLDAFNRKGVGMPVMSAAALTVAVDVVQAWAVFLTLGFTMVLFFFLAFCVCSKKDDNYDEFEITQGHTTIKLYHDGAGSFLPHVNGTHSHRATDETSDVSSRCTMKRELPAIPHISESDDQVGRIQSPLATSLYPSISDSSQGMPSKIVGGVQVLPASAPGGRSTLVKEFPSLEEPLLAESMTESSSDHQVDASHGYAKVQKSHHSYAVVSKEEHPYAKVASRDSEEQETDTDNYDDVKNKERRSWESDALYEPPPMLEKQETVTTDGSLSPKTAASVLVNSSSSTQPAPEFSAAQAISGQTRANEELPYMTPPLHRMSPEQQPAQQHFSGDSQDSRGYTSISVREPLSALKAQGIASAISTQQQQHLMEGESYYMTVSDDSADEMYASIYEGSRGAGSETYAQIGPRVAIPIAATPAVSAVLSESQPTSDVHPPPAPPSVDSLRHVVHSRQASSSSAASTVMGSPGTEKRGTRSPLPPVPQGDSSFYSPPASTISTSATLSSVASTTTDVLSQRPLDDMYAKVIKKQRGSHSRGSSAGNVDESSAGKQTSSRRGSADIISSQWSTASPPRQSVDLGSMTHSLVETERSEEITVIARAKSCETSSWNTGIMHMHPHELHSVESNSYYSGSLCDHGYETVKNSDPPYAFVDKKEPYPGYETVQSDIESEPGYETLKHQAYEAGYETVLEAGHKDLPEPGYETLASISSNEPGYETVSALLAPSLTESGYECVKEKGRDVKDPSYEEVQAKTSFSENDPNYEQLRFESRRSSEGENDPGYEVVKSNSENAYERVSDYETKEKPFVLLKEEFEETKMPVYATVCKKSPEKKTESPEKKEVSSLSPSNTSLLVNISNSEDVDSHTEQSSNAEENMEVKSNDNEIEMCATDHTTDASLIEFSQDYNVTQELLNKSEDCGVKIDHQLANFEHDFMLDEKDKAVLSEESSAPSIQEAAFTLTISYTEQVSVSPDIQLPPPSDNFMDDFGSVRENGEIDTVRSEEDSLPPPPPTSDSVSPPPTSLAESVCSLPDLPPPVMSEEEASVMEALDATVSPILPPPIVLDMQHSVFSNGAVECSDQSQDPIEDNCLTDEKDSVNVTVNPMAEFEEGTDQSHSSWPSIATVSGSSNSTGTGSMDTTGSGSIESVIAVEPIPTTTTVNQQSLAGNIVRHNSKEVDPNEEITPV